jgi:RNA polymerase sigma-70 factor (ECF subfamily)
MAARTLDGRALSAPAEEAPSPPVPAIGEVYDAHFRYVWRCLRSLGVPDAALDDALQDVFLVVQRKLPEFEGRSEVRTWLYAIALRVGRRYRVRARSEERNVDIDEEHGSAGGEAALEQSDRLELARRALGALDDEKREVFVLAHVEQMSAPEIASILTISVNTVYSRLRAARAAFAAEVRRIEARTKRSACPTQKSKA